MMTRKPEEKRLRKGWTTGACAAAAARAAFHALRTGHWPAYAEVTLPKGETPRFRLMRAELGPDYALAAIEKDAGDDPDVTHGAWITAKVSPGSAGSGLQFRAGPGVGIITRPGLPLPPGEPAINPKPREIIEANLRLLLDRHTDALDLIVEISVPGGEALAEKTWNPRLGIVGGISILGTTGIVIPYSCSAWIHAIYRGIDVARANNFPHVAAATGKTSDAAVRARHSLPLEAMIDMGDFVGGMLKYLRRRPLPRLTIAGGFAKMVKLSQGHLDLHSSRSQVDFLTLAQDVQRLGGGPDLATSVARANTATEVLAMCRQAGLGLPDQIAVRARSVALAAAGNSAIDIMIVDRSGTILAETGAE